MRPMMFPKPILPVSALPMMDDARPDLKQAGTGGTGGLFHHVWVQAGRVRLTSWRDNRLLRGLRLYSVDGVVRSCRVIQA